MLGGPVVSMTMPSSGDSWWAWYSWASTGTRSWAHNEHYSIKGLGMAGSVAPWTMFMAALQRKFYSVIDFMPWLPRYADAGRFMM